MFWFWFCFISSFVCCFNLDLKAYPGTGIAHQIRLDALYTLHLLHCLSVCNSYGIVSVFPLLNKQINRINGKWMIILISHTHNLQLSKFLGSCSEVSRMCCWQQPVQRSKWQHDLTDAQMLVTPLNHQIVSLNAYQSRLRFWSRSGLELGNQWRHSGGLRYCPGERWLWWLQAGPRASYSGIAQPGSAASLTDPETCCTSATGPWELQDSQGTWTRTPPWRSGSHTTKGCHGDLGNQDNLTC